jgi:predicted CoA-binding protein
MEKSTIAIIGASSDRSKFGNKAVRAFLKRGWDVYPVNPKGGEIEGLKAYPSLKEIPVALNRVSVYLPPERTLKMLDEISVKMCDELWLNPGSESPEVIHRAQELGLEPISACSIVDIGENPSRFSDE